MRTLLLHPLIAFLPCACTTPVQEADPTTLEPPGERMPLAYSNAIAAYMQAVYSRDEPAPDTVFIGRQIDICPLVWSTVDLKSAPAWVKDTSFMSMELPSAIQGTNVRFATPDEAEQRKDRPGLVLLNMFAWFAADTAEFKIVTFRQGFRPQHDCSMGLIYNAERREFDLDSVRFEYPYP